MGEIQELAGRVDEAGRAGLLAGQDTWTVPGVAAIGLGAIKMSDGPNGVRGAEFVGGPASVLFPSGTALASTWNPELVQEVGRALGAEAHSKGAHVHLAPTINLHRGPLGGRNFECFSEDPHLSARLAVAYIRGVQSQGVASCVKHLVANDYEFERFTTSSDVDERVLRELYLVPFEAALLEAGAWSVMSAYNKLNGTWCSENPWLLTELLRDEWGWDGVVVSDWYGTHTTVEALRAGLDIEMPGPPVHRGDQLAGALADGQVSSAEVRRSVERVLLMARRTGALAQTPAAASDLTEERFDDDPERTRITRQAAVESIVVLRNEAVDGVPVLPLATDGTGRIGRLAVVGPNAAVVHAQGGGSARIRPPYLVSPLQGLTEALPEVEVVHCAGSPPASAAAALDRERIRVPEGLPEAGAPGLLLCYYRGHRLAGPVVGRRVARRSNLIWLGGAVPGVDVEDGDWSARVATSYRPRISGRHHLHLASVGRLRVSVDGAVVHEDADPAPAGEAAGRPAVPIELDAGTEHLIELELVPPENLPAVLGCDIRLEEPSDPGQPEEAAELARSADAAVVVVGLDADIETEGRDRTDFALPAPQVRLIEAVAAANPRTVVVVNTGSPVQMDWVERVPAVVQLWCAGQEAGRALAEILTGAEEPSGRLPTTFACRLEDTPAYRVWPGQGPDRTPGHAPYTEGLHVGYRHYLRTGIVPRFWFGHGLSYTTFEYGDLRAALDDGQVTASASVTNTGPRRGAAVLQLYVRHPGSQVERPEQELRGFAKVVLDAGQEQSVSFRLGRRDLAYWDASTRAWQDEAGPVELLLGVSAGDIRSRCRIERR